MLLYQDLKWLVDVLPVSSIKKEEHYRCYYLKTQDVVDVQACKVQEDFISFVELTAGRKDGHYISDYAENWGFRYSL